jgi:hypothetical protein
MPRETHLHGTPPALGFLRRLREDASLAQELRELTPAGGLEPVLELAAAAGYEFSAEELRRAHRVDWQLRRAAYAPASAASTVAVVNRASSSR